ncbi:MAG: hypothetical protein U1F53_03600 [Burkholderiaceae bacterium]
MPPAAERPAGTPVARRHPGVALAVLAAHVLLALGLWQTLRWRSVSVPREPSPLVWVQPLPPAVAAPTPTQPPQAMATPVPTRPLQPSPPRATLPTVTAPPHESTWVEPAAPVAAAAPASAASTVPTGRLMDSAATRAAIRQIGQQPLLHERAAAATQMPIERTDTALAREVAEAGTPDCMKDPAAATGQVGPVALGGILGLPFLAARVATGKCAK